MSDAPLSYLGNVSQQDGGSEQLDANTQFKKLSRLGAYVGFAFTVLEQRGWLESARSGVPSRGGQPYPLLTWPFVDFLESLDTSELSMLEFGSGQSTLYFQQRFRKLTSIETNPQWHQRLAASIDQSKTTYLLMDEAAVIAGAWRGADADFALIDCACNRFAVARQLIALPVPVIVLDNADWHPNTARLVRDAGYFEIPFWGLKNGEDWESCTSLFIRPESAARLRIRRDVRPALARAMIGNPWDLEPG
jgi:hypothetical protein